MNTRISTFISSEKEGAAQVVEFTSCEHTAALSALSFHTFCVTEQAMLAGGPIVSISFLSEIVEIGP